MCIKTFFLEIILQMETLEKLLVTTTSSVLKSNV
jgi:hypothetical protein